MLLIFFGKLICNKIMFNILFGKYLNKKCMINDSIWLFSSKVTKQCCFHFINNFMFLAIHCSRPDVTFLQNYYMTFACPQTQIEVFAFD